MSRMRKTHVRFCESKENRVAPYFLATRFTLKDEHHNQRMEVLHEQFNDSN